MMNLPNRLTIMRIILIPFFLLFMVPLGGEHEFTRFVMSSGGRTIAIVIFVIASLTDLFDGMLARRLNLVSTFGKFLDPIADKLLVIAGFIAFAELGRISTFVVMTIIFREFVITGVRLLAAERGVVISASWFGKIKAVLQMFSLIVLMFEPLLLGNVAHGFAFMQYSGSFTIVSDILLGVTVAATLLSGLHYLLKNRAVLNDPVVLGEPECKDCVAGIAVAAKESAAMTGATVAKKARKDTPGSGVAAGKQTTDEMGEE